MDERDVVMAADGSTVLGVGRITGSYYYDESDFPRGAHRRKVQWHNTDQWSLPQSSEGLQTTVSKIRAWNNRLALEEKLIKAPSAVGYPPGAEQQTRKRYRVEKDSCPGSRKS